MEGKGTTGLVFGCVGFRSCAGGMAGRGETEEIGVALMGPRNPVRKLDRDSSSRDSNARARANAAVRDEGLDILSSRRMRV